MLNSKMLCSREAGHMVQVTGQRLDTNCSWEQCRNYTLCGKDCVQWTTEVWKLPQLSPRRIQITMVPGTSVALNTFYYKIALTPNNTVSEKQSFVDTDCTKALIRKTIV